MLNATRTKFTAYANRIALLNGVAAATVLFTVNPTVQQTLEKKIQEQATLLGRINVVPVPEQEGSKLGLGVSGPGASRTNTSGGAKRGTKNLGVLDERGYRCEQTNFDTHVDYATLDAWAKFPNFETMLRDMIVQQQALDRITIGWNGTSVAADTDIDENPLLEDVNKGWLQHIREQAPARHLYRINTGTPEVPVWQNEIRVGPFGDYANLDALVFDAIQLLDPWFRESTDLNAFTARELMHDKYFGIINQDQKPTETIAAQTVVAQKKIGGLPASTEASFPPATILVTSDKNLSIYYQDGKRRRHLKDVPEGNRIENYESSNDAYVVERLGKAALIENIVIGDWTPAP
tara:strand:- start:6519 stop:7565 length:1047 start_codon:yes stop_codon:yes gene_type:complete